MYLQAEEIWTKALAESAPGSGQASETAARDNGAAENIRYQVRDDADGNPVVVIEGNIFEGHKGEAPFNVVRDYLRQHIGEYYTVIENGQRVYLGEELPGEYTHSKYTQSLIQRHGRKILNAKNQAAQGIGELIEIARNPRWEAPKTGHRTSNRANGFYRYDSSFQIGNRIYDAVLVVRDDVDGKRYLYDIVDIKNRSTGTRLASTPSGESYSRPQEGAERTNASTTTSIPENSENRNRQNRQNREENSGNQYQLSEDIEAEENADIAALSGGENGLLIRVSPVLAWQGQPKGTPVTMRHGGFVVHKASQKRSEWVPVRVKVSVRTSFSIL